MGQNINILGTDYILNRNVDANNDGNLIKADGYVDYQTKEIFVSEFHEDVPGQVKDIKRYERHVVRHELLHAFLYESGLTNYADDEQLVEWLAVQIPKVNKLFNKLEINS